MKSRVLTGDCLRILPDLESESFDLVVTDPPYGTNLKETGRRTIKNPMKGIKNDERPFVWWLPEAYRLLKPDRVILCFCRWDVAESFRLAMQWAGFTSITQLIWDKGVMGMGHTERRPGPRHETIWFGVKGQPILQGDVRPSSVVSHTRIIGDKLRHPNQKPVPLLKELIRDYCPPGGSVLDPFAGSGSGCVAAALLGHPVVGVELDEKYARLADRDLQNAVAARRAGGGARTLKTLL